jgi:SAM-dependent methyltransferase
MTLTDKEFRKKYIREEFPLSSKYDPYWVSENEMGPNPLWLTESLCQMMDLKPGMRVLDMGCGKALSSIFLAKEFGLQVWANDLWIDATDNLKRIREAGVEDRIFPIHAEARSLPYAEEFFDAIISVDSYHYFGTDLHYLESYMLKLLKPGAEIGIAVPASPVELPFPLPDHLGYEWHWINSLSWWKHLWERFPGLENVKAETVPNGWKLWLGWMELLRDSGRMNRPEMDLPEIETLRADKGEYLGFIQMIARRKA